MYTCTQYAVRSTSSGYSYVWSLPGVQEGNWMNVWLNEWDTSLLTPLHVNPHTVICIHLNKHCWVKKKKNNKPTKCVEMICWWLGQNQSFSLWSPLIPSSWLRAMAGTCSGGRPRALSLLLPNLNLSQRRAATPRPCLWGLVWSLPAPLVLSCPLKHREEETPSLLMMLESRECFYIEIKKWIHNSLIMFIIILIFDHKKIII